MHRGSRGGGGAGGDPSGAEATLEPIRGRRSSRICLFFPFERKYIFDDEMEIEMFDDEGQTNMDDERQLQTNTDGEIYRFSFW
jgi:hypothetical protein